MVKSAYTDPQMLRIRTKKMAVGTPYWDDAEGQFWRNILLFCILKIVLPKSFHLCSPKKALDTFGNCQKPVFSLDVSQLYMHKRKKSVKIWIQFVIEVAWEWWKKKSYLYVLSDTKKASGLMSFIDSNMSVRNYFFLKNYISSEGAVSYNVLYYQKLSIARYKVIFLC